MVTGQKVRWVLDLMRGTEFAGPHRISRPYDRASMRRRRDEFHDVVLQEAGPGESRCDLAELKTQMLALGDDDRTMRFRLLITPHRHVLFDAGPVDGFGWSSFTVRDGAGPATAVRERARARERAPARRRRTRRRDVHDRRRRTASRLPGSADWSTAATAATPTTTPRPTSTASSTAPTRCGSTTIESGPVRARIRIESDYTWPACAIGDDRACSERSDDDRAESRS